MNEIEFKKTIDIVENRLVNTIELTNANDAVSCYYHICTSIRREFNYDSLIHDEFSLVMNGELNYDFRTRPWFGITSSKNHLLRILALRLFEQVALEHKLYRNY